MTTPLRLAASAAIAIALTTGHSAFGAEKLIAAPAPDRVAQQPAATPFTFKDIRPGGQSIVLRSSQGTMIRLSSAATTAFVADADVADVNVLQPDTIYVFGKKPGATVLYVTDVAGNIMLNRGVEVQDALPTIFRGTKPAEGSGPRPLILTIPLQPAGP
jgi:Flp pilus assembly secretin CpaC